VSSNSDITSPKQLEGKRIAVDSLYQMPHLTLVNALAASGVDTTKVKFIELPSNAQLDALNKGQVDAVDLLDPFIAKGLKAKAIKPLLSNTVGLPDKSLIGVWMTSQNFVNEHADTVQKFVDATNKSLAYAQAHPDEFRATFAKFADVDPNLASQLRMHNYEPGLESSDLDVYADLLGTYGADKKRPDTKGAIYVGKG
jgi:NitT/TauT family transport system substrate-binding protein